MKTRKRCGLMIGLLSVALTAGLSGTSVGAESGCKGLEQGACENKSSCYWVDGYTRKDGIKVSAYCRTSSKQSSSSSGKDKSASKGKSEESKTE